MSVADRGRLTATRRLIFTIGDDAQSIHVFTVNPAQPIKALVPAGVTKRFEHLKLTKL